MKDMGSYTKFEVELSQYSIDELNEMYLNGDLDKAYDDFERENQIAYRGDMEKEVEELEAI